ncbi:MAG: hypothetical protein LBM93_09150 [Oscillospiraceae bacterium]|jgi:hypothetical protein|nr:hypothetical protein [Oscillospiraceae bacterium]
MAIKIKKLKEILEHSVYSDNAELIIDGTSVKIIEPTEQTWEEKSRAQKVDELMGVFNYAADPSKIPFEKDAWADAAVEKWRKFNEKEWRDS